MSSPFELRFSCLNLAKEIVENYQSLKHAQSTALGSPAFVAPVPETDEFVSDVLSTAHKFYLFVNNDLDKLDLPSEYSKEDIDSKEPEGLSLEKFWYAKPSGTETHWFEEAYVGVEGSSVTNACPVTQSQVFSYARRKAEEGLTVIYVLDDLSHRPKAVVPETLQYRTVAELKFASADLIVFDSCNIQNDLTLILPIHRFRQVIVYRGFESNPTLSSDDYFSHFMVNANMTLVGKKHK